MNHQSPPWTSLDAQPPERLAQCLAFKHPWLQTFRASGIFWGKQATDRAGLADRKVRS